MRLYTRHQHFRIRRNDVDLTNTALDLLLGHMALEGVIERRDNLFKNPT